MLPPCVSGGTLLVRRLGRRPAAVLLRSGVGTLFMLLAANYGSSPQAFHGHPLIASLLQRRWPGAAGGSGALLDVGCGDGNITLQLARLPGVAGAVGLDSQASLIAEAQLLSAQPGQGRVRFVHGDATDTQLFAQVAGSYRFVTCFTTLHWMKAPPQAQEIAMVNFARALEERGRVFVVHFLGLDDRFMEVEREVARRFVAAEAIEEASYTANFANLPSAQRLAQYRQLFELTGLAVEEACTATDTFPMGRDQYPYFLRAAATLIGKVPEARQQEYLDLWLDEMVRRRLVTGDGPVLALNTVALVAVLRKDGHAPAKFYEHLLKKCREGVLALPNLGRDIL